MLALTRLKSDVPVTTRIGWRTYQQLLTLRELGIRVLDPELHVGKTNARIEITVSGTLSPHIPSGYRGQSRWRPLVVSLHISERFADEDGETVGDILVVPVVGIRCDKEYDDQPVKFQVTVQQKISSYRWNRNRYRVTCGHIQRSFEIIQFNKDGMLHEDE
jgi:hypothetical protein